MPQQTFPFLLHQSVAVVQRRLVMDPRVPDSSVVSTTDTDNAKLPPKTAVTSRHPPRWPRRYKR